jgi:type IV pilus assembly protein PilN
MIRINLLPYRASKKKETATQQLVVMSLILVAALLIAGVVYFITTQKISIAKKEITNSETELANLKKKIGEIDNLKKLQAEVQKKLDVLAQLRKEKTGPAIRLARLSDMVPEKMWLTKYQEGGNVVSIGGLAFNEDLIAGFMRSIQASDEFGNVELQVSEQQEVGGIKYKRFELTCVIKVLKKDEPAPKKQ